jgi:hypothetical protein
MQKTSASKERGWSCTDAVPALVENAAVIQPAEVADAGRNDIARWRARHLRESRDLIA